MFEIPGMTSWSSWGQRNSRDYLKGCLCHTCWPLRLLPRTVSQPSGSETKLWRFQGLPGCHLSSQCQSFGSFDNCLSWNSGSCDMRHSFPLPALLTVRLAARWPCDFPHLYQQFSLLHQNTTQGHSLALWCPLQPCCGGQHGHRFMWPWIQQSLERCNQAGVDYLRPGAQERWESIKREERSSSNLQPFGLHRKDTFLKYPKTKTNKQKIQQNPI